MSERGAFTASATAKAVARTTAPIALEKTMIHVGIDGPSAAGHRGLSSAYCISILATGSVSNRR